jgi:ubiquinone/menaquinone biosynthesis C-methylase UbiE
MSYFSLACRVPETEAVDPKALVWLYDMIVRVPLVRTTYRHFIRGVLAQGMPEGPVLDVGTGPGHVAVEIARRTEGLNVVGLDLAAHMAKKARKQAGQAGLLGRGLWPQADGHRLPFADDSFQMVFSSFALHHWDDPLVIFNEIARVLAPGGRYYIADLCREPDALQRAFAYASIPAVSLPFGSYLAYGGYYESVRAAYTREQAQELLEASALPPGSVKMDSTWFIPILGISSMGTS